MATAPLRNLQALRGVAALLVVGAHLGGTGGFQSKVFTTNTAFARFGLLGNVGVDMFFVISGFIMMTTTTSVQPGRAAAATFLRRRATRVYPPYLVITLVLAVLHLYRPSLINSSQAIAPNVIDSFLLLPQRGLPLLLVGWTLTYELYFYLVFSVGLFLTLKRRVAMLGGWLIIIVALSPLTTDNAWVTVISRPLNLEFLLGVGLAILHTRGSTRGYSPALAGGLVLAAVGSVAVMSGSSRLVDQDWPRVLVFGLASGLIVHGLLGLESRRAETLPTVAVRLGDVSYSLYLTHILSLKLLEMGFRKLSPHGPAENVVIVGVAYAGAVVGAFLFYRVVELPLLRILHDRGRSTARHISEEAAPSLP